MEKSGKEMISLEQISWLGFALWSLFIYGFGFVVGLMCQRANLKEEVRLRNAAETTVVELQEHLDEAVKIMKPI